MEIGSVGSLSSYASLTQAPRSEAVESGPDRDHDGDEGPQATTAASSQPSAAGRGQIVNFLA